MKTLLVPTDLSPLANAALPVAVRLAQRWGAEVRVLHFLPFTVIEPELSPAPVVMTRYLEEQTAEATEALERLCAGHRSDNVRITPVVSRHSAGLFGAIVDERADLIVLASHGAEGWSEWLVGSNAEEIVNDVDCPVLVLKEPVGEFSPKKILYAIDADERLYTQFVDLFPEAEKEFLFVATPHDPRMPEGIEQWVDEWAKARQLTDSRLHVVHHPTADEGILLFAEQHAFDLIVLFTTQRKGFWHFLNGSVAEDVVNHARTPVLVVPLRGET
jgi:nucleotide-binding universal stress UspA family protein